MGEIDVALPPRSFYAKIVPKIKIGSDSFSNSLTEILKLRDGSHAAKRQVRNVVCGTDCG